MRSEVAVLALAFAVALLGGCGEARSCGAGTVLKDGRCVPKSAAPTCGAGTVADGGVCVATGSADTTVSDAADTADAVPPDVADIASLDTIASDADATAPTCDPACASPLVCSAVGTCVPPSPPTGWTCAPGSYAEGEACHCGCGAIDPDCKLAELDVIGCPTGKCAANGTCAACVPQCAGNVCGPDGCGGDCGTCTDPQKPLCKAGACIGKCVPACTGLQCGDDGCGGQCGACGKGQFCSFGQCAAIPKEASCVGQCGGMALAGCSCKGGCAAAKSCCLDVETACGCQANCDGKTCGPDGCGGVCGQCATGEACDGANCTDDPCDPDPCTGHGACNAKTSECACKIGFGGANCAVCDVGFAGYPTCTPDFCALQSTPCNGHGKCNPADGGCSCNAGFVGVECEQCGAGKGTWPNCTP